MGAKLDFDAIKRTVLIPMVLKHLGRFEQFVPGTGKDNWRGPCPFNTSAKPDSRAFAVFEKNLRWRCHDSACEGHPIAKEDGQEIKGGNVLDLIMAYENISAVYEGFKRLAAIQKKIAEADAEVEKPKPLKLEPVLETQEAEPESGEEDEILVNPPLTEKAIANIKLAFDHKAVKDLGLSADYAKSCGIGFKEKGMLGDHVLFPIHNLDGKIVGYGGLNPEAENLWEFPPKFTEKHMRLEIAGYAEVRRRLAEGEYHETVVCISFSLLEQAVIAEGNLSLAILSNELSKAQKSAITSLVEEFPEIAFLVRVTRERGELIGTKAAVSLLPFLTPLSFTKCVTFKE